VFATMLWYCSKGKNIKEATPPMGVNTWILPGWNNSTPHPGDNTTDNQIISERNGKPVSDNNHPNVVFLATVVEVLMGLVQIKVRMMKWYLLVIRSSTVLGNSTKERW